MVATWTLKPDSNSEDIETDDETSTITTFLILLGVAGLVAITWGCCWLLLGKREVCCRKKESSPIRRTPIQRTNGRPTESNRFTVVNSEMTELLSHNTPTVRAEHIAMDTELTPPSEQQTAQQGLISHFEGRGYSNTARVLREIFNRQGSNTDGSNAQPSSQTNQPPPTYDEVGSRNLQINRIESNTGRVLRELYNTPTLTDTNETNYNLNGIGIGNRSSSGSSTGLGHNFIESRVAGPRHGARRTLANRETEPRDTGSERTQQSWSSYFNTANRLRNLISDTRTTRNEADSNYRSVNGETTVVNIMADRYHPRPRTPPPAYHEVESSACILPRTNSLPSYDEFIMMPHIYAT